MTTTTFQLNTTYITGGHDYVWTFTVIARTAKFITVEDASGEIKRVGVTIHRDREVAFPLGTYSMAPLIAADRIAA